MYEHQKEECRMKQVLIKLTAGVMTVLLMGCSASASGSSPSDTADISATYAKVTAVSGTTITAVTGTVKEQIDSAGKGSTQSDPGKSPSASAPAQSVEAYYGFKSGAEDLSITIDPDITVLEGGSTMEMSDIETGDLLMLTYKDSTLRAIEILTAPDSTKTG